MKLCLKYYFVTIRGAYRVSVRHKNWIDFFWFFFFFDKWFFHTKTEKKKCNNNGDKKKILRVVSKSSAAFVSGGAEVFCLWGWPRICGGGYRNITSSLFSYPPRLQCIRYTARDSRDQVHQYWCATTCTSREWTRQEQNLPISRVGVGVTIWDDHDTNVLSSVCMKPIKPSNHYDKPVGKFFYWPIN